ncbi:MAG: SCP2 sterol-binding domain-containing protein [Thermoplasmata archaeon]
MEELLKSAIEKFNEKCKTDKELQKDIECIKRTVQINITDGKSYKFVLQSSQITDFAIGTLDNPDVLISSDNDTMKKLLSKEMSAMKAYVLKKIKIKASLEDLLTLKKFM